MKERTKQRVFDNICLIIVVTGLLFLALGGTNWVKNLRSSDSDIDHDGQQNYNSDNQSGGVNIKPKPCVSAFFIVLYSKISENCRF